MRPLRSRPASIGAAVLAALLACPPAPAAAQSKAAAKPQALDEAYTAKIKEYTVDPRVITELVDHLPPRTRCRRRSRCSAASRARRTN
jgi:hypothetical protein